MGVAAKLLDGLRNVVSGAATSADKRAYDRYTFDTCLTVAEVEAAYRTSGIVRKIHDKPPFDMTREWRDWQADGPQIEALEAEEKRLGLAEKIRTAETWARLYGGSAIILGAPQGDAAMPLNLSALKKGGLRYVHVVTRHQVTVPEVDTDPESDFFGQPRFYELTGQATGAQVRLHPSRVVSFVRQPIPAGTLGITSADAFWGDPLLMSIGDAVRNSDLAQGGIASLIHELSVDTLGIPNLTDLVSTAEGEARLLKRITVAALAKSQFRTRINDAEETWETRQASFASLPETMRAFLEIAAAVADMPVTVLLGTSPRGLNATGEGDAENYDATIQAKQKTGLAPALDRIDAALIPSALGTRPAEVYYEFAPLAQSDPKEESEIALNKAKASEIYAKRGLIPGAALAKAVQNQVTEDGLYPGIEGALEDAAAGKLPEPILPVDPNKAKPEPKDLGEVEPEARRRAANDAARLTLRHLTELANELGIPESELRRRLMRMIETRSAKAA